MVVVDNFVDFEPDRQWMPVEYGVRGFISDKELVHLPNVESLLVDYMMDWLEGLLTFEWRTMRDESRRGVEYYFSGETWTEVGYMPSLALGLVPLSRRQFS